VIEYYSRALAVHGCTPRGVDWASQESQELRFRTLLAGAEWSCAPTLLDYGCGYGALATYLDRLGIACKYVGFDVAPSMIDAARKANPGHVFTGAASELAPVEYVVASGIFNVKLDTPTPVWERYVHRTLGLLASLARRSLSFNMLPPASAPRFSRPDLYYADPEAVVSFCEQRLGHETSLQEDYGLWEFTVTITTGAT
jgi:SAM-dependent methyltransferase